MFGTLMQAYGVDFLSVRFDEWQRVKNTYPKKKNWTPEDEINASAQLLHGRLILDPETKKPITDMDRLSLIYRGLKDVMWYVKADGPGYFSKFEYFKTEERARDAYTDWLVRYPQSKVTIGETILQNREKS